ncbi:CoA-binding protein [Planktothrix sp. FACHB-1355]|uniref:CoA-binding protein n=1 Tax=Aerosakkonema funiforme FACHB-1375 TaxID=2949571 RepID=A0A926VDV2_9CYAN|nr:MULTISPECIES: CoA-binding protein [Oscillatoriales]MBD2181077.1 CoA-binding protein [Aerosakkonema funiforme FACHB-1375]MBD3563110.1 CoA-binding protein [Planktothrix sp. FACHB-1355]
MNVKPDSKVLIQGITEPLAAIHAAKMKAYGTNVVAGVSPGQGGQTIHDIPVFDLVEQALPITGSIDTSIIFTPPYLVLDAALEAIAANIRQLIIVTSGIPPLDIVYLLRIADANKTLVVGPNSMGIIVPGKILLGTHPSEFYTPGAVGLISRCGSLTCEVALQLSQAGFGQSIGVNIGSDAIVGSSLRHWLPVLNKDDNTKAIVLVGQMDGDSEETIAPFIAEEISKPVVTYIAGRYAPTVKRQRRASDLIVSQPVIEDEISTAEAKIAAFEKVKIPVAQRPSQIPELVKKALKK